MNRIHKCRVVDILTKTQYIDMYERMKNKQIEAYKKYMEKHEYDIDFKEKKKSVKQRVNIVSVRIKINYNRKQCNICTTTIDKENLFLFLLIYNSILN